MIDKNEVVINIDEHNNLTTISNDSSYLSMGSNPALAYLMSLSSKKSRKTMSSYLSRVAGLLGSNDPNAFPWDKLRRHHVQGIQAKLQEEGKAPSTCNTYMAAIKGVAMEAWSMGLMSTDDYQAIKAVKPVKGSRLPKGRSLKDNEIRDLIRSCEEDSSIRGVRDTAIVRTLVSCGLRRSELAGLRMSDLDFSSKSVQVIGKGNKQRKLFCSDKAWESILTWIEDVRGSEDGFLFTRIRRHGEITESPITDQAVYYILQERASEADIKSFSPHDLRRTFATNLLSKGVDISLVQSLMGHSDISTTTRYDMRGDDEMRNASRMMDF